MSQTYRHPGICGDSPHCCPFLASCRELTATKWYSTTVSIASAPREFARLYNVVFEIILSVYSVGDDERALNSEQRGVGNEQDEPDVVVAVNLYLAVFGAR